MTLKRTLEYLEGKLEGQRADPEHEPAHLAAWETHLRLAQLSSARDQRAFGKLVLASLGGGALVGVVLGIMIGAWVVLAITIPSALALADRLEEVLHRRRGTVRLTASESEVLLTTGALANQLGASLASPNLAELADPWYATLSTTEKETFDALVGDYSGSVADLVAVTRTL